MIQKSMKKVLLLGLLLFSALVASAQVAVKGVVIAGDDGLPMVGASVFEKGTLNGKFNTKISGKSPNIWLRW